MKYQVKITLIAKQEYTYEIEAQSARQAEDKAFYKALDDFDGATPEAKQDDCEVEQLTIDCEKCGKEYQLGTNEAWDEDSDFCAGCGAEIEAEDKDAAAHEEGAQS